MYRDIKEAIFGAVPASSDATHIYLGLAVLLITTVIARRSMASWGALAPVLVVSVVMEGLDLLVMRQSFSGAVRDVVHFCLAPFLLVFFLHQGWAKS